MTDLFRNWIRAEDAVPDVAAALLSASPTTSESPEEERP